MAALEPPPGKAPGFAQLYVLDSHSIADTVMGMAFGRRLNGNTLQILADMLKQENAYVRKFVQAAGTDAPQVNVVINGRPGPQARSYAL